MISFADLTAEQIKALLKLFGNQTIAELFAANEEIKENIEDSFTIEDESVKLSSLKGTNVNLYESLLLELANAQADEDDTTKSVVKTYNEMSPNDKFAELQAKLVEKEKVGALKKSNAIEAYVSISSISTKPSQAAKGKSNYVKEGEGFITLKDAIRKDGEKFSKAELKAICAENQLGEKSFAYCLDLLNAGQKMARVKIEVHHRNKSGVRRYPYDVLVRSLNGGKTKFDDVNLEKQVSAWFNANAVEVPSQNGKIKVVVCYMPTTNSDIEVDFYPFFLVESGEIESVQKVFNIREDLRIAENTKPEQMQQAALETDLLLTKVAKMKAMGLDNELIAMLIKS